LNSHRVPPSDRSCLDNPPFEPEPQCPIHWGLYCVAVDARFAVQNIGGDWKAQLALAHLVLEIERLRRKHAEYCDECNPGAAA
jgi:hypothetical protein